MPFFEILTKLPVNIPVCEPSLRGKHLDAFILEARRELWDDYMARADHVCAWTRANALSGMYPTQANEHGRCRVGESFFDVESLLDEGD